MHCPHCKTEDLKATKLEDGLPAYGCSRCEGALVSLLYYRDWVERTGGKEPPEESQGAAPAVEARDSLKCKRLMSKFNISGCSSNRVDLCGSCDEAWLDGGEWELLKALQLNNSLPSVFTDAWQRKVRKQRSDAKRQERFTRILGETDVSRAEEVRQWLVNHPKRQELLFYLAQE